VDKIKIIASFVLLILSGILYPAVIFAQTNFQQGETVLLPKDQVVNKDYFATGESINLAGTINGDAYLAGGNITVEGVVNGDLLAAGGNINIRGQVTGDIRTAGGSIIISSKVGQNVTAAGGNINFTDNADITGSIVAAGGNLDIFSPIGKDLTVAGGSVNLGNSVSGDVLAGIGELTLTPSASVSGNLDYWSTELAQVSPGASVSGQINHYQPPAEKRAGDEAAKGLAGVWAFFKLVSFISSLAIGLILLRLVPGFMGKTVDIMKKRPWVSLLVGFIAAIAIPILFIALLVTVFGIPLALVLLGIYLLISYFTKIFVALVLGQILLNWINQKTNIYLTFTLGLIIYYIISLIPVLGGLLTMIACLIALGALLIAKKELYQTLRDKKLI
jgi:hypothetical protein